jgi:hypothetical protein
MALALAIPAFAAETQSGGEDGNAVCTVLVRSGRRLKRSSIALKANALF